MLSLNLLNSVTKKIKIRKEDCRVGTKDLPCKRQRLSHRATGNRADPYTEPKSCLSDFSDSPNSLNLLNSMKVLLHLEKTPVITSRREDGIRF